MIESQPKKMTVCTLECVLMPQGELITKGKSIGWFKDFKDFLHLYTPESRKAEEIKMLGRGLWLATEELLKAGCQDSYLVDMLESAGMARTELLECLKNSSYCEDEMLREFIDKNFPDGGK